MQKRATFLKNGLTKKKKKLLRGLQKFLKLLSEWHLCSVRSQDLFPTLPHLLYNHCSWNPFAGYHLYFSRTSFDEINCCLHQTLSCVPWRETERAGKMERTHAENNLVVCAEKNVAFVCSCVCVWQIHTPIWRVGGCHFFFCFSVLHPYECLHVCTDASVHTPCMRASSLCVRQGEERTGFISTCRQWVFKRHEASCLRAFSLLMHFPVWLHWRDQKVLGRKPKSYSLSDN